MYLCSMKRFGGFIAVITLSVMILWAGIGVAFVHCNHSNTQRLGYIAESHCCCESHNNTVGECQIDSNCMTQLFAKITDFSVDNTQMPCFEAVQHVSISDLWVRFNATQNLSTHSPTQKFYPPPRLYLTLINILII